MTHSICPISSFKKEGNRAPSSSILLPQETVVEEKKTYILDCTVAGFYPESVQVFWKNAIAGIHSADVDNSEYLYKSSIWKDNGTFSGSSSFILFPVLEDNRTIYQCVNHKSPLIPLQNRTTLTVTELSSATVWMIVAFILLVILVIWLCFFIWEHCRKVAPDLSPLPATEYLKHQELKTFHFVIWHYRPKPLMLKCFLKTNTLSEEELLIRWTTQAMEREENLESMQLMETQSKFTLSAVVSGLKHNFFGISGSLTLVSDLAAFSEADLFLQVEHSSLKTPSRRKIHLKVIAQPKLKKIQCSSDHLQPGECVTLACRIHFFFPRDVRVSWYKEDRLILEGIETSEAAETLENGLLCSCISKLEFFPQMEDFGRTFICQAEVERGVSLWRGTGSCRHWVNHHQMFLQKHSMILKVPSTLIKRK
ncbi:uncharacterized protein [Notamacropus eugenii]|uniref:uncharacterized protein n=1 Tax=Notamacropus eugenii TaxID=9315 RepID=UPI003B67508A